MKNPYAILNVDQNASKEEVQNAFIKAQMNNAKTKMFDGKELMDARNQLMKPDKRLVADFLFPAKFKSKRPKLLDIEGLEVDGKIDINSIDEELFDSLKTSEKYV